MRTISVAALALAATLSLGSAAMAQSVSYTGGSYTQNFDTLATTGTTNAWANGTTLNGWYAVFGPAATANVTRDASTTQTTVYIADTGSSNSGGVHSHGVAGVNALTERALGSVGSGGWEGVYAVVIQNNTGADIIDFTLTYDGEQWRNGNPSPAAAHSLVFDYRIMATLPVAVADFDAADTTNYTAVPALNFTGPLTGGTAGAVDGNAAANRVAGITANTAAFIPNGSYLILRWWDNNDASNDHGLSIDNINFSANVPTPGAMGLLGLGGLALLRRRR